MVRLVFIFLLSGFHPLLLAQHQGASWSTRRAIINQQRAEGDSLCNVLHNMGTFEGHIRNYFMGTANHEDYPDYTAWAVGGGLAYFSPVIYNFQVGMSGFIIYNLTSSDLSTDGPYSNRYEVGLFDITDPENHHDLDRLEDLYLRYYFSIHDHSYLQVGKFHLNTPLLNLQDGRMRPNLQEGVWGEWSSWNKVKLKGGWLWRTSPRSTVEWYDMSESIGVYSEGRATNGERSQYHGHIETPGISISNVEVQPSKEVNLDIWNYYVPNLFNLSLGEVEYSRRNKGIDVVTGFQYYWQSSLFNEDVPVEQQYIQPGEQSHAFSARVGFKNTLRHNEWFLNYTRITSHGRFLFPREWGVESFYTRINRERVEGSGDVHALMLENYKVVDHDQHLAFRTMAGVYWMPQLDNALLNKYSLPSFYQFSLNSRYNFGGFLHGLQADLIYTFKGQLSQNLPETPAVFHNKVDMHHITLVLDYYF